MPVRIILADEAPSGRGDTRDIASPFVFREDEFPPLSSTRIIRLNSNDGALHAVPIWVIPARPLTQLVDDLVEEVESVGATKPLVMRYNLNGVLYQLPAEVRELIYDAIFHDPTIVDVQDCIDSAYYSYSRNPCSPYNPPFLPPMCKTSVETLWDSAPAFIRNAIFEIRSFEANQFINMFLESIPGTRGYDSVKRLHFHSFQHFPQQDGLINSDIALVKRCSSLHTVLLNFHVSKLVASEPRWDYDRQELIPSDPRSVKDIVEYYQLEGLFECASLKKIILVGIDQNARSGSYTADPLTSLRDLGAWLKNEFAQRRNRDVRIGYHYRCGRYPRARYRVDAEVEE